MRIGERTAVVMWAFGF